MTDVRLPQHGRDHRLALVDGEVRDAGSDPVTGLAAILNDILGATATRIVYGAILNDGTVLDNGSGDWEAVWDSRHTYTIDIDPPLDGLPVALGLTATNNNPSGSGEGRYIVSISAREADGSQVTVITQDADDPDSLTDQDGSFDFAFVAGTGVS